MMISAETDRFRQEPGPSPQKLSGEELTILRLLAGQLINEEIMVELGISRRTLREHYQAIFTKLGVDNRWEAVQTAAQLAIL